MKIPRFLARLLGYKPVTLPTNRTIQMSGRAPVRIETKEWPVVVQSGTEGSYRYLVVRRHLDGRTLVYGRTSEFGVAFMAGYLVKTPEAEPLFKAVQKVASEISSLSLGQEILAQFPPESL